MRNSHLNLLLAAVAQVGLNSYLNWKASSLKTTLPSAQNALKHIHDGLVKSSVNQLGQFRWW